MLTPNFECEGLSLKELKPNDFSIVLPVGTWLRQQLTIVENYARQNIDVVNVMSAMNSTRLVYKPFWPGNTLFVRVSSWCQVYRQNVQTGQYESVDIKTPFGRGTYNVTLTMPYIYFGPHKNGEDFSINLRVDQIVFNPEVTQPKPVEVPRPTSLSFKASETKGRRRKSDKLLPEVKA